ATLLLRPTIPHPDLSTILDAVPEDAMHLKMVRDEGNRPVDALHVHSYAPREITEQVEQAIWSELHEPGEVPTSLGNIGDSERSEPLALTQLLLLYHLVGVAGTYPQPEDRAVTSS
ncbi:MAG: hypothetical protein M3308_00810, partial [Actinomycetota bacterium]|nr:hypothetical protein [Actinomycetota bacterium]